MTDGHRQRTCKQPLPRPTLAMSGGRSPLPRSGAPGNPVNKQRSHRALPGLTEGQGQGAGCPPDPGTRRQGRAGTNREAVGDARAAGVGGAPRAVTASGPRRGLHPTAAAARGAPRNWGAGEWSDSAPQLLLGSRPAPRAAPLRSTAPAPPGPPAAGRPHGPGGRRAAPPRLARRSPAEGYGARGGPGCGHEA